MNIAILAPSPVPFTNGGAERLLWGLFNGINHDTSHQAELIKLPSPERNFPELISSYKMFSELKLDHFDRVITTKYPAWMIDHPDHYCYLLHKLRGLYDTYHFTGLSENLPRRVPGQFKPLLQLLDRPAEREILPELFGLTESLLEQHHDNRLWRFPGPLTRAIIHKLDAVAQRPGAIKRYATISNTVKQRRDYFPDNSDVSVLYPPTEMNNLRCEGEQFLFTASRLDEPKRIGLLIEAFRQTTQNIELRIAGTGPQEAHLKQQAAGDPRIRFLGRVDDRVLAEHYANALFIPFIPHDEDYGLITIEAMKSGKAVLTCEDSGGVTEFVEHGHNGLCVAAESLALRDAINRLLSDPQRTREMGQRARETVADINWKHVIEPLVEPRSKPPIGVKRRVVIASTFPAWPPRGGGQSRLYHLYREVAHDHRITFVSLGPKEHHLKLGPQLFEHSIPYSATQARYYQALAQEVGTDISDIGAIDGCFLNQPYMNTLRAACQDADLVIASHPFLYTAIRAVWDGPVAYDAQDIEADMKTTILADHAGAAHWIAKTARVERLCAHDSHWHVTCSEKDKQRLEQLYGPFESPTAVAANGVSISETPYQSPRERRLNRERLRIEGEPLLFIGSWHGPNITAAQHLLAIARKRPDLQFWLMGSICDHPSLRELPDNVVALGVMDNPEKTIALQTASIALNPMTEGSGTNLKMLEYAAAGLDIISTAFGNRGLDFKHDEEISIAELEQFEQAIDAQLALAEEKRDTMTQQARTKAEKQFDWSVCAAPISELIESIPLKE